MKPNPNDFNPSLPNIHDGLLEKAINWWFWCFALATAGVIGWMVVKGLL